MLRRGLLFEFDVPDGWKEAREGNRFIYRGPQNEEMIVTGYSLRGTGPQAELDSLRKQMLDDAMDSVRKAAAHPELVTAKDLGRDEGASHLECWTMVSQTRDGQVLLSQAIVLGESGVLLATLESPKNVESFEVFRRFLMSVRRVLES